MAFGMGESWDVVQVVRALADVVKDLQARVTALEGISGSAPAGEAKTKAKRSLVEQPTAADRKE